MSEIAIKCGVSRQVVSAVLNPQSQGNIRFSLKTRKHILSITSKYNYRPNRSARKLISRRHGSIGMLINNIGHINNDAMRNLLASAKQQDQVLLLDYFSDHDQDMPVILKENVVDGIIVFEDIPKMCMDEIQKLRIPCVHVNSNAMDLPGSVTYDEHGAMAIAVNHLIERGRKNLALVLEAGAHYSSNARREGFIRAASDRNIPGAVCELRSDLTHEQRIAAFLRDVRPDGVVLSVDSIAPALYKAAKSLALGIPSDISVLGVNNSFICKCLDPKLSSLGVNFPELGRTIAVKINEYIKNGPPEKFPLVIKYSIEPRESS